MTDERIEAITEGKNTPLTNPKLPEAVQDAQTLLAHASRTGVKLDADIVNTIVETGTLLRIGEIKDALEAKFWSAMNSLAKAVEPVTVSSLRATMDSHTPGTCKLFGVDVGPRSLARRAVRWYTGIALLSLFVLLVVQIYWLFGTSITADIQRIKKEYTETETKIRVLKRGEATVPEKKPTGQPSPRPRLEDPELKALQNHREDLILQGDASYNLLNVWSNPWERAVPLQASCKSAAQEDLGKMAACEKIARYQATIVVLDVLQRYILPLLYGLLGTCVYILRTLTSEIRARIYSESSNIGFRIRLYLGTLGGIVVAWFLTPETADGIFKSLSPFALAFLAGYSIELVFAAMDRIISAFTNK